MNATQLLNSYKISITQDSDVMAILSVLYRDGPQTDDYIYEAVKISHEQFTQKRLQLFRAGLIKLSGDGRIELTDQAISILHQFGITELAAKSLVEGVSGWARTFLQACIEAQTYSDTSTARQNLYLLRILRSVLYHQGEEENPSDDEEMLLRLNFNCVVGLDPDSQRSSGVEYVKQIFNWHQDRSSSLWKECGHEWLTNSVYISYLCHNAIRDANKIEKYFYSPETPSRKLSEAAYLTAFTRILKALLSREPDPGLRYAFRINNNLPQDSWNRLEAWKPDILRRAIVVLNSCESGWSTVDDEKYLHDSLSEGLYIVFTTHQLNPPTFFLLDFPGLDTNITHLPMESSIKTSIDATLSQINLLRSQLNQGYYDNLSPEKKVSLCNLITQVAGEFNVRLRKETDALSKANRKRHL